MRNKKFDVNVKNEWNQSILYEMSINKSKNKYFTPHVEYLLQQPKIIVSAKLISSLIASNNTAMLALYKKYKKVPKSLLSLI